MTNAAETLPNQEDLKEQLRLKEQKAVAQESAGRFVPWSVAASSRAARAPRAPPSHYSLLPAR